MSIVEKAINKMHKDQGASARAPASPPVSAVAPQSSSPAAAPSSRAAPTVEAVTPVRAVPGTSVRPAPHKPSRQIAINFEALRAAGMLAPQNLMHQITEQYRRIKWPLLDAAFGKTGDRLPLGNLIVVSSSTPNEGKTYTALHLALSIAQERDCSVLLVDADVAKAHLTGLLGLRNEVGLVDVLADENQQLADAVLGTDIEGLEILPAGRRDPHAPEYFASRRMQEIFLDLATRHPDRIILFDSSPLLATNEAQVLARLAGQTLLVVRANHTPQQAVLDALGLLDRNKAISCVLNQVPRDLASEYYGVYGNYGQEKEKTQK